MPVTADLRAEFLLDPGVHFLNHGSFGACPRPVFERYLYWAREVETQPVDFFARRLPGLLAESRARLAEYLHVGANDVVYVPNATHGVNIVARSLRLGPGDEVLATDHEYGACDRAWRYLAGRHGFGYRRAEVPVPVTTPDAVADAVWSAVGERTRVLFLSHISSATALIFPVAELCRRARAAGVLTVVDGAHAPGQIELDLAEVGADFYTGNCHKWLCAPKGAAFLHTRPEAQHLVEPLIVGWGWEPEIPGPSPYIDQLEFTGVRDMAAALTVPDAIDYQMQRNWSAVRQECHRRLHQTRDRAVSWLDVGLVHAQDDHLYSQMSAFTLPAIDPIKLQEEMYTHFRVEAPFYRWHDLIMCRISVQAYNTDEDLEVWLDGLGTLLGHRHGLGTAGTSRRGSASGLAQTY